MNVVHIVSTPTHVSFAYPHDRIRVSIASADLIKPGIWWVSRVRVPDAYQGRGIGTKILQQLLAECAKQGATEVHVTPGGYNADPDRQVNFYAKVGFVGTGLMIWKPNDQEAPSRMPLGPDAEAAGGMDGEYLKSPLKVKGVREG